MEYVLGLIFLMGGGVLASFGYAVLVSTRRKQETWIRVKATVIDFRQEVVDQSKARSTRLYAPVYRYILDGTPYTGTSNAASSSPGYTVGNPIEVLVNPLQSSESEVADASAVMAWALILMGTLAFGIGAFLTWLAFTGQMKF